MDMQIRFCNEGDPLERYKDSRESVFAEKRERQRERNPNYWAGFRMKEDEVSIGICSSRN